MRTSHVCPGSSSAWARIEYRKSPLGGLAWTLRFRKIPADGVVWQKHDVERTKGRVHVSFCPFCGAALRPDGTVSRERLAPVLIGDKVYVVFGGSLGGVVPMVVRGIQEGHGEQYAGAPDQRVLRIYARTDPPMLLGGSFLWGTNAFATYREAADQYERNLAAPLPAAFTEEENQNG